MKRRPEHARRRILVLASAALVAPALAGGCSSSTLHGDGGDAAATSDGGDAAATSDGGDVAATSDGGDAAATCVLDAVYVYGEDGGFVTFQDQTTLTPPGSYRRVRHYNVLPEPPVTECAPPLPACNTAALLDVADIMRSIANADVQHALAMTTPPLYGRDDRPTDGSIFKFQRADGRGFLAGPDCTTGQFCGGPLPDGIARLVSDLQALDQQQLAAPACAAFAPSH
jgi:hypothetical protein